jgi:hypothetical protein
LRIELQWAKDSPVVPAESAEAPGVVVRDRTAAVELRDRWALFTLLRRTARRQDAEDPSIQMLRFEVATAPAPPPEAEDRKARKARQNQPPPQLEVEPARVYLRLGLRAPELKEKTAGGKDAPPSTAEDLEVPAFPVYAPRWTYSGDRPGERAGEIEESETR